MDEFINRIWESDFDPEIAEIFKGAVIISAFRNFQFFVMSRDGRVFKVKFKEAMGSISMEIQEKGHIQDFIGDQE